MFHSQDDIDGEKPLDPAVIRVQQRLRGMMLWSRGIMLIGFAALFAVIFYKFYWVRQTSVATDTLALDPVAAATAALPMPIGGRITEAHAEGNRLVVTIDAPAAASVLIIDLSTLTTVRRVDFNKAP
jgi:hypothetical protein